MIVHFICRGNTYRSRLAEVYLNSKKLSNIQVFSSGIEADNNISGPIIWYAQKIIQQQNLVPFEKMVWDKTTRELLEKADFTIFMHKDIYDFCVNNLGFNSNNFEVWDIPDANEIEADWKTAGQEERVKITEKTFEEIKKKIEELIAHGLGEKFE